MKGHWSLLLGFAMESQEENRSEGWLKSKIQKAKLSSLSVTEAERQNTPLT